MPGSTLLLLVLLVIGALVSANGQQLANSGLADYTKQLKRGVLLKNKKLTSCELAPIDNECSIVAASCLEYLSGTTDLDLTFKYEVLLDDGIDGIGGRYTVENITINPHFDPKNLVNDLAILQHNSGSPITWQNRISPYSGYDWDAILYSRAIITDVDNPDWSTVLNATGSVPGEQIQTGDLTCKYLSVLFDFNFFDIACSPSMIGSSSGKLSKCSVPMGIAYSIAHNKAFIVGPYSYSEVVGGNSFCNYSYQRSYYTAIYSFRTYIEQVIGRDILVGDDIYPSSVFEYYPDFHLKYPTASLKDSLHPIRLSGDFYSNQSNIVSSEPASISDLSTQDDSSSIVESSSIVDSSSIIDSSTTSSEVEIESSHGQINISGSYILGVLVAFSFLMF